MHKQILVRTSIEEVLLREGQDVVEVAALVRGAEVGPGEDVVGDPGEGDHGGVGVALEGEADGVYAVGWQGEGMLVWSWLRVRGDSREEGKRETYRRVRRGECGLSLGRCGSSLRCKWCGGGNPINDNMMISIISCSG
jgi:hypothetical protein